MNTLRRLTGRTRVALHPEGVDRNTILRRAHENQIVALHPEGVDRNIVPSIAG